MTEQSRDPGDLSRPARSAEYEETADFIAQRLTGLVDLAGLAQEIDGDKGQYDGWRLMARTEYYRMIVRQTGNGATETVEHWSNWDPRTEDYMLVAYRNVHSQLGGKGGVTRSITHIQVQQDGTLLSREGGASTNEGIHPEPWPVADDADALQSLRDRVQLLTEPSDGQEDTR